MKPYAEINRFIKSLKNCRLTPQQYRTLKGQALSGDLEAAMKGLNKIKNRKGAKTMKVEKVVRKDILVILDREEAEFIKNDVIDAISDSACCDKEWLVKLAAKFIEKCESVDKEEANEEEKQKSELKAV